jgi:hypothetical protein
MQRLIKKSLYSLLIKYHVLIFLFIEEDSGTIIIQDGPNVQSGGHPSITEESNPYSFADSDQNIYVSMNNHYFRTLKKNLLNVINQ